MKAFFLAIQHILPGLFADANPALARKYHVCAPANFQVGLQWRTAKSKKFTSYTLGQYYRDTTPAGLSGKQENPNQ